MTEDRRALVDAWLTTQRIWWASRPCIARWPGSVADVALPRRIRRERRHARYCRL